MQTTQTYSVDNYTITQLDATALQVKNENDKDAENIIVVPTTNPLNPNGLAFNLRDYTKGSFTLTALATYDLPILTYYAGFKPVQYTPW